MAGEVENIKVYSPLKLRSGLTGKYHAICHYSYNLPLGTIKTNEYENENEKNSLIDINSNSQFNVLSE